MDVIAKREPIQRKTLDFSHFEELSSQCRDILDTILVIEAAGWVWNGRGLDTYVKRNGFSDPNLLKIPVASIINYEVISHSTRIDHNVLYRPYSWFMEYFILGMWGSIRSFDPGELEKLSEDDSQLVLWAGIFKLCCISWSRVGRGLHFSLSELKTWEEICHEKLPGPEHAKFRDRLLRLEDIHGDAIRKRFPPEEDSIEVGSN